MPKGNFESRCLPSSYKHYSFFWRNKRKKLTGRKVHFLQRLALNFHWYIQNPDKIQFLKNSIYIHCNIVLSALS